MQPNRSMRTFAADFGNYELKFVGSDLQPRAIRSIHYRLPKGVKGLVHKPSSPLIELPEGERYHFGHQAFKYRSQEKTVIQDKALLAKLHLYACLDCSGDIQLVISHHSPDEYRNTLEASLLGEHTYIRNGIEIQIDVKTVDVIPEGQGAYWLAQSAGLVPNSGYTIVIDIGGGSWLSSVYDEDGAIISHDPVDRMGSYALALQIANDKRLKDPLRRFGTTMPDVSLVLNGFALGHTYAESGITWKDWMEEYLDPWYRNIFATVKAQYQPHLSSTRRFIVTGGGAHLIAERVQKSQAFAVMPDPNFANVLGMYHQYAEAPQLAAVA